MTYTQQVQDLGGVAADVSYKCGGFVPGASFIRLRAHLFVADIHRYGRRKALADRTGMQCPDCEDEGNKAFGVLMPGRV